MSTEVPWKAIAAAHRQRQKDAIPPQWVLQSESIKALKGTGTAMEGRLVKLDVVRRSGLLDARQLFITESFTAKDLLQKIQQREFSSEEVTIAFCKRAALAQQLTSCLTEIFFEEGIERARWLDQQLQETDMPVGPLHGLPISLKDSCVVKGHYATVGYVEFLKRPLPLNESTIVKLLLDAGAVLYCKTNVPQTMMTADSENHIFGRTLNPHKTSLTAGGSSGGEGALISLRGSVLGVGTDIAGSIRIPSLCCGIYGFKPTADRVPLGGHSIYPFPRMNLPGIIPAVGPMANSIEDLLLFMEAVIEQRPWKYDVSALDIPWRKQKPYGTDHKLVIGVLPEDADYPLHPPVHRVLKKAATLLEQAGHKVVHIPADPKLSAGFGCKIGYQYFAMGDTGLEARFRELGEPPITSVARGVHPFTDGDFPVSPTLEISRQLSDLNSVREAYAACWQKAWLDNSLDAIICPGAVSTAVPHDTYGVPLYTLMWNVLDYPAGIIPFGFSSQEEDPNPQKPLAAFNPAYDPVALDGAPCAIQVACPRFHDEECLDAMHMIDEVLRSAA